VVLLVLLVCLGVVSPFALSAQARETAAGDTVERAGAGAAVSPDSADRLRESLERPRAKPPFDVWDGIAMPFRIATYPVKLFGDGVSLLLNSLSGPGPPPFYVIWLRQAREEGVTPSITSLDSRSGPAIEVRFDRYEPLFLETAISIFGSQRHRAGLEFGDEESGVTTAFGFQRRSRLQFFGVGPGAPERDESDFRWDNIEGYLGGRHRLARWFLAEGEVGYEENYVARGFDDDEVDLQDRFDTGALFGAEERTRFFRLRLGGTLDFTRRHGLQTRGVRASASNTLFFGAGPTDADFNRVRARVTGHLPLNERQSLVLHGRLEANEPTSGPGVPFTHLAAIGDDPGSRGLTDTRFRDEAAAAGLAEWRYMVWPELRGRQRAEGFVFVDQAAVTPALFDIGASTWVTSYGGGLRLVGRGGLIGSIFLAYSEEEGLRLQTSLTESF